MEISSEHYYSCELTRRIPVRVRIMTINGDTGFGIIEPLKGDEEAIRRYVSELRASSSTLAAEITYRSPDAYWTRVVHSIEGASIYETVLESGCMTLLPISISRGVQMHSVLAPSKDILSRLLHLLKERFSHVKVVRVRDTPPSLTGISLTSKQRQAVTLAIQEDYYSIPRRVQIAELASEIGISRVAMQERLRRAEKRIMEGYLREKTGVWSPS
jgi:hypothetical protein